MNENNSPLQFFIFVVRSRHSRVLSADVTSLFGNRLDRLGLDRSSRLDSTRARIDRLNRPNRSISGSIPPDAVL